MSSEKRESDQRASSAARVLFGLFVVWASFYLVALAQNISDAKSGVKKESAHVTNK